jgi:hypothetical protein
MVYNSIVIMLITEKYNISLEELTELIEDNSHVKAFMGGQFSEFHFRKLIKTHPDVTHWYKPSDNDASDKGDVVVTYKDVSIALEVKTVRTSSSPKGKGFRVKTDLFGTTWHGHFQIRGSRSHTLDFLDGSKTRTYNVKRGQYDIIVVCVYPFTGKYEYMYCLEKNIPSLTPSDKTTPLQASELLKGHMKIQWPPNEAIWTTDLSEILEQAYQHKVQSLVA